MKTINKDINVSILKLLKWLETQKKENVYLGFDPYDAKEYFNKLNKFKPLIIVRKILYLLDEIFCPNLFRKLLLIKPKINAKGQGLLLYAFSQLYITTKNSTYLNTAESIAKYLIENPSKGYAGLCWGYPFDWQSIIFIPKNTPSTVVSTTVGDGLFKLYEATKNNIYLENCKSICEFLDQNLNISAKKDNSICISYTPLDTFQVHNANLFTAEFLIRIGTLSNNKKWVD